MKVTVRDCLQLESFRQCIVVAGERSLDNRVKTVSVLDAATIEDAKNCIGNPEELVLTSFSGMRDNRSLQCETLRVLAKSGIAALAVFQKGNNDVQVSKELINAADEAGLPLLGIVPEDQKVVLSAAFRKPLLTYTKKGAAAACKRIALRLQGVPVPIPDKLK